MVGEKTAKHFGRCHARWQDTFARGCPSWTFGCVQGSSGQWREDKCCSPNQQRQSDDSSGRGALQGTQGLREIDPNARWYYGTEIEDAENCAE